MFDWLFAYLQACDFASGWVGWGFKEWLGGGEWQYALGVALGESSLCVQAGSIV